MMLDRCRSVLIVGAGEAGREVASQVDCRGTVNAAAAGFLDDDPSLAGTSIDGIPVLGTSGDLERIASSGEIDEIIIAVPSAPGRFVRDMIKRCRTTGLPYKIVPGVMEIIRGSVHIDQIREVRVEDLLGRETVDFDIDSVAPVLAGRRILVTGAGGSIGAELCRHLARVGPAELIVLGRGENRIFDIEEQIRHDHPELPLVPVIDSLREPERIVRLLGELRPEVVYHTAAHKHVHYMERDPEEAVLNNVAATINLIDAARGAGASRFVFISTDKAADPRGVMGATKRLVERYLRAISPGSPCRFITVRFGNVIGSTGSVVPLFIRQINRGGPVTVSDPQATRYFMTVKEAALLVIEASVKGDGGATYILDMGEALNILEMARDIILLTGHEPGVEIPIEITGLREGEKLHEVLVGPDETLDPPEAGRRIMRARQADPIPPGFEQSVGELVAAARAGDRGRVLLLLAKLVPGFDAERGSAADR